MSPTRPMNINTIIITFPTLERSDVMPSDMPHVPNADVISNNSATAGTPGSVMSKISNAVMTMTPATRITAYERNTSISLISRLNTLITSLPTCKVNEK